MIAREYHRYLAIQAIRRRDAGHSLLESIITACDEALRHDATVRQADETGAADKHRMRCIGARSIDIHRALAHARRAMTTPDLVELDLGNGALVASTLRRLLKAGMVRRVTRGSYVAVPEWEDRCNRSTEAARA